MGPKSNDKCPYKREADGDLRQTGGGHVTTEVEKRPIATGHWKG